MSSFIQPILLKAKAAKWNFISQVLCSLVEQQFGFSCFCLTGSAQRMIYSNLPVLLGVEQDMLDISAKELSQVLYSDEFLAYQDNNNENYEEEEYHNPLEPEVFPGYHEFDEDD